MSNNTIYILIAAVIAVLLAAFFYLYRTKKKTKTTYLLFALRSLSLFLILLLLFNLKVTKRIIKNSKPKLFVLIDNSKSIALQKQTQKVQKSITDLKEDITLNNKFELNYFIFGTDIKILDSLNFSESKTNIQQALEAVNELSKNQNSPILLISDGNQTIGNSYEYTKLKSDIYPVIIGDTTSYQDLFIDQLNANKYAYLKHKFPVEVFVGYQGQNKNVPVNFTLREGNNLIYNTKFIIGKENNSKHLSFKIPANRIGLHHYIASISNIPEERNTINNKYYFSVEIISEEAKILLISNIIHPDIALFKRAIESNEQRKVIVKKPTDKIDLTNYKSIILYQPQANFKPVFNRILTAKKNVFFVTGSHTNWQVLNQFQSFFKRDFVNKPEDYFAVFNTNFNQFLLDDVGFENLPPVQDKFGEIKFNVPFQPILFQKINGFTTEQPLMATFTNNQQRFAALFGENSWRWRIYEGKTKHHFKDFDTFINKTMQFLSAKQKGDYLELSYKKKYFSNENITVKAQVFDVNYQFNPKKKLWIKIKGNNKSYSYPFALETNTYQVKLTDLSPGLYYFTVYDSEKKVKKSGSFSVLNFEIEQQSLTANVKGLQNLMQNNKGKIFFPNQINNLINDLINNKNYKTIQKETIRKKPLIDWKILLASIILLISAEWFIRKYKGYI